MIANKLGASYDAVRAASRIKTISVELNDVQCELKVRIPVKREMEEMQASIHTPEQTIVDAIYKRLSEPLLSTVSTEDGGFLDALNADGEKLKITDNDVIVSGTSIRQVAMMTAIWQVQVERYFALIQTPTGEPVDESYDEIAEEFPEASIREIITKIDQAIRPNYGDTKKN